MSLSNEANSPSKKRYYIGRNKPKVDIMKVDEMHWTEQMKYKPKDDTPRPYRESGDFDNRTDNWDIDVERG